MKICVDIAEAAERLEELIDIALSPTIGDQAPNHDELYDENGAPK